MNASGEVNNISNSPNPVELNGNNKISTTDDQQKSNIEKKKLVPWPIIIVGIIGIIIIIYIGIGPNITSNKRIFGITLLILWTLIWCLLLWVLWNENYYVLTWWLMIIPIITIIVFFVVIIFLIN